MDESKQLWRSKSYKYGIIPGICGVYKITNKLNGKFYIGSSVDVAQRIGNHMNRDSRLYPDKEFYKDVKKYGWKNFEFEIIEVCEPENKIEREAYWYDQLKPEYNMVRPTECNFIYEEVRRKAHEKSNDEEHRRQRKELYNSKEYVEKFRKIQTYKMQPCVRLDKNSLEELEEYGSYQEASRWVKENTKFKSKNMTSKIREVCIGTRTSAFGYKWKKKSA